MKSDSWLHRFLHNQPLKHKLYVIIFESDTPAGKAFDVTLIICILLSILLAIIESLQGLPSWLSTPFIVLEYLFTVFFTFEYVTRIYCSPNPRKYIFSFFGIVDLLATLPLYLAFFLPCLLYTSDAAGKQQKDRRLFPLCCHPRRCHRHFNVHD